MAVIAAKAAGRAALLCAAIFGFLWILFWDSDECAYYSAYVYAAFVIGPAIFLFNRGITYIVLSNAVFLIGGIIEVYGLILLFRISSAAGFSGDLLSQIW